MTRHFAALGSVFSGRSGPIVHGMAVALGSSILLRSIFTPLAPFVLATLATVALLAALSVRMRRKRRGGVDRATGLPDFAALENAATARANANIVVAHIDRYGLLAAKLGPAATARMVARIAERLAFGHASRTLFRLDDASLAWLEAPGDEDSLEDRLEALAALMRSPIDCGREVDVSLAFGLATGRDAEVRKRIVKASLAARHAAHLGMRWKRSLDDSAERTDWSASLPRELDGAMASGQLWVAYQPQLDIDSGRFGKVEAFVRWLHPRRGPISPGSFVPLVEAQGRARDLTAHVLIQALEDASRWDEAGFPIGVAVNISAVLLTDHEFIETIGLILQSSRLPAHRLTVEVAEAAVVACPDRAAAALESWRSHGMDIAISGYGMGRSPLGLLRRLPATSLKIDKNLIRTIAVDPGNAATVRAAVLLGHRLGMKVVAEGVEDAACLAALGDMGCDIAQGYHIARPMTGKALTEFLAERARAAA